MSLWFSLVSPDDGTVVVDEVGVTVALQDDDSKDCATLILLCKAVAVGGYLGSAEPPR